MPYFNSPKTGTGSIDDPIRPVMVDTMPRQEDVSWSGIDMGTNFLVWVDAPEAILSTVTGALVSDADALKQIQQHNPEADNTCLSGPAVL